MVDDGFNLDLSRPIYFYPILNLVHQRHATILFNLLKFSPYYHRNDDDDFYRNDIQNLIR